MFSSTTNYTQVLRLAFKRNSLSVYLSVKSHTRHLCSITYPSKLKYISMKLSVRFSVLEQDVYVRLALLSLYCIDTAPG